MQLIRGTSTLQSDKPVVATIGNFDGMHLGHLAIMRRVKTLAAEHGGLSCVVSFHPLPHEVLSPDTVPARLQGTRDRLISLKDCGIDRCLLLPFTKSLSNLSANDFIQSILLNRMNLHTLIVGDDFRFGHERSGSFSTLVEAGAAHGFTVEDTPTVLQDGERISSTRLRSALQKNDLQTASELLGRDYRITGRVVHGEKVGRQLGFPTANIALKRQEPPLKGVFAVRAHCDATGDSWPAVANLGRRPTVNGLKLLLEVHLLDASEHLYGKHLNIDFLHFIRGEKRFESLDELKEQIQKDADTARTLMT